MKKVLMGDVKSNSKNVKKIFKETMGWRDLDFLKSIPLTNDEIVETVKLAKYEGHVDFKDFIRMLTHSQTGPFNEDVFYAIINHLWFPITYKHLLNNMNNPSDMVKSYFLKRMLLQYPTVVIDEIIEESYNFHGILNVKEKPFNKELMIFLNELRTEKHGQIEKHVKTYILTNEILGTMSEKEILNFIDTGAGLRVNSFTIRVMKEYPETPKSVFEFMSENLGRFYSHEEKIKFSKHKNFPEKIKAKWWQETKDPAFLYGSVAKFFIFPE